MPGLLKDDARCPICSKNISCSFRTSRYTKDGPQTVYEYEHINKKSKTCKETITGKIKLKYYELFVYQRLHQQLFGEANEKTIKSSSDFQTR